jgi:RimJ/RimL family protein N-acetyltransferase
VACTYPRLPESIKVMERCGMTYVGDGDEPGTVKYQRRRG